MSAPEPEEEPISEIEQGLRNFTRVTSEIGYQVTLMGVELQKLARGYEQELERIKQRATKK